MALVLALLRVYLLNQKQAVHKDRAKQLSRRLNCDDDAPLGSRCLSNRSKLQCLCELDAELRVVQLVLSCISSLLYYSIIMYNSTLSSSDTLSTAPPVVNDFYTKLGVPRSGVSANRENIRRGLRFSPQLIKAVEEEFTRRLQEDSI